MNSKCRFEIENECDFSELDDEGRLMALRVMAEATPAVITVSFALIDAVRSIAEEAIGQLDSTRSLVGACTSLETMCAQLQKIAGDYINNLQTISFELGAAMGKCGLKPSNQIIKQ